MLMQSEYAKSDRKQKYLRIGLRKTSDIGPKYDDLAYQIFKKKNGMV